MKLNIVISLIILFVAFSTGFVVHNKNTTPIVFKSPKGWQQPVYNFNNNPLTAEGFELGKKLFYDAALSKDSTTSCASCHQQFAAFSTYDHNLSHGINNSLTTRNAPALQNLVWQKELMLDGSILHLDNQPIHPLTSPIEMGITMPELINRLKKNKAYKAMFKSAYKNDSINEKNIAKALSQFMVMLVSSNSKYDKVMRGEAKFILPEQLGYEIFKKKCVSCHSEPFFTDFSYRNIGMPQNNSYTDNGRMDVTKIKSDSLKFKVPSLRNIALTQPYGHDGRFFTLYNVFEHYRKNMIVSKNTDSLLRYKLPLSNYEIGQLTAFLYTLTDSNFINNKLFAPQGYNITPTFMDKH